MNRRKFLKTLFATAVVLSAEPIISKIAPFKKVYFDDLLKEYLPHDLLISEMSRKDSILDKIAKDQSWHGSSYSIPIIKK